MTNRLLVLAALVGLTIPNARLSAQQRFARVSPAEAVVASEVSIAINPANFNNLVAGSLVRGIPGSSEPSLTYYSLDGGATWTSVAVPNPDKRTQGDDIVLFNREGLCVRAFISFTGLWEEFPERAANGIAITRSTDGGVTWSDPTAVADHFNTKSPMEDKPWLVFDRTRSSPHVGNLYCAWTRFDVYGSDDPQDTSQIMFARSRDGGETFEPVIRVSDQGGDCLDDDNTVEGAVPCVHPDGTVFIVWAGPRGLEMDASTDGGRTFGTDRVIGDMPGGWSQHIEGVSRHNGMPVTGVDHSGGPNRGSLYVNWIDERNEDADVFVKHSRDKGATWSDPVRVNDDPDEEGRDQLFTWMAVDPLDGSVNVVFYDRRDTVGTGTRLTLARSIDGGLTFRNIPLDFPEFECGDPKLFFGDYLGIDAIGGRVATAFMHYDGRTRIAISSCVTDFRRGTLDFAVSPPGSGEPEFVTVQHLLVAFEGTIPDKQISRSRDEAEALARDLYERARTGADFDELIRLHTDDEHPGIYQMANFCSPSDMKAEATGEKVFPRSLMVSAFGDTGFGLVVDEIGLAEYHPVNSKYGWHIIKRIR